MKRSLAILLAATACGGVLTLTALPARAGLFDDDEARTRLETLRKEVNEHFTQVDTASTTTTHNQIELSNQIEQLKTDLAKIAWTDRGAELRDGGCTKAAEGLLY